MEAAFRAERWVLDFFLHAEPTLRNAFGPLLLLSVVLFVRHPATNYIFDEQEALLANPYVNATQGLGYLDAIYRDFWGLPPHGSIGSYRPIPNLVWRATWALTKHPWFHHLYNLLFHGLNGALLASFAYAATRRRLVGWLTGVLFVSAAILTEAVSGIVGIADVLGGLGAILALVAVRLPARTMPLGVFAAVSFGLFCKESALVCVPLVPSVALLTAPLLHAQRPARWARFGLALVASAAAFVVYVELRRQWFPSPLPAELKEALPEGASQLTRWHRELMVWFHQAPLPKDPLNNPLAEADGPHRVAGALRVYFRGLTQLLFPLHL
ncbi:MAG: tetratricopeptide repeat protein, partial [Myxococcales bacterium]|nr:tetratricopeptide repeat protein [Myxococcales bacterium]